MAPLLTAPPVALAAAGTAGSLLVAAGVPVCPALTAGAGAAATSVPGFSSGAGYCGSSAGPGTLTSGRVGATTGFAAVTVWA
jgi:hypothetical protein